MIGRLAILLALSAYAAAALARSEVVIVLRDQATVDGANIRVADVADVRTADDALRARIEQWRIASAPAPGVRRALRRDDILRVLAQLDDRPAYAGEGATQASVQRRVAEYPVAQLVDTARQHLERRLRDRHPALTRIEIVPAGRVANVRLPVGAVTVQPRLVREATLAKRMCVWLDLEVDGKRYASVPVWLSVQAYAPVLVAGRRFEARQKIDVAGVATAERDIAGVNGVALARPDDVRGRRVRVAVSAGSVVRAEDLEPNPPVLANQEVDVRVMAGPVEIRTKAIAEQEGKLGQMIRVRNPSSASVYRARVTGDNAVVVAEREE